MKYNEILLKINIFDTFTATGLLLFPCCLSIHGFNFFSGMFYYDYCKCVIYKSQPKYGILHPSSDNSLMTAVIG